MTPKYTVRQPAQELGIGLFQIRDHFVLSGQARKTWNKKGRSNCCHAYTAADWGEAGCFSTFLSLFFLKNKSKIKLLPLKTQSIFLPHMLYCCLSGLPLSKLAWITKERDSQTNCSDQEIKLLRLGSQFAEHKYFLTCTHIFKKYWQTELRSIAVLHMTGTFS